jgi:hypothetical protein
VPRLVCQVGQVRAPRAKRARGIHRLGYTQMRGVRPPPQRVQYQYIQSLQVLVRTLRDLLYIGDIRQVREPIAKYSQVTVIEGEWEHVGTGHRDAVVWLYRMQTEARLGGALIEPYRIIEDVVEGGTHLLQRFRRTINGQRLGATHREDPEIIDAVDMVGVLVGVHHRIDP